jgi:cellulose binding protein with CBM2 domain
MGNPGRRRRTSRRRWLRALGSRDADEQGSPGDPGPGRLIAEPAEFGWPDRAAGAQTAQGWSSDPAAYQWMGGWTDEPAERRLLDGPADPDWPVDPVTAAGPVSPGATAQFSQYVSRYGLDQPGRGPGRRHQAARAGWLGRATQQDWYLSLARYRWYIAVSAGAVAMVLASGVILVMSQHATTSAQSPMADSRMMHHGASAGRARATPAHPAASPTPDASAHRQAAAPAPAASTAAPTPAATGAATPSASQAPGFVAVTYRLLQRWSGGIVGKYTIANHSNVFLSGWQFTATFPGDEIQSVLGATDPDLGSDVLVLEPSPVGSQIAPGGKVSVVFTAAGPTAYPTQCAFNGTAC